MIISDIVPLNNMCTLSLMSACENSPQMSDATEYLFSLASMYMTTSMLQLMLLASWFLLYLCIAFGVIRLNIPMHLLYHLFFSFRNIQYHRDFFSGHRTIPLYFLAYVLPIDLDALIP